MGKSLKGKELGVGISQRKDGLYTARFTDSQGKRKQKYFKKLQECRNWIADAKYNDEHGGINAFGDITVSEWFDYWVKNIIGMNAKNNTIKSYSTRFKQNIEPCIGTMLLIDVKPLHCQNILNQMSLSEYQITTINLTRTTIKVLFDDAVENELITKNPVTKSVKCKQDKEPNSSMALTVKDQERFVECIKRYSYYYQYAFVLQTGLRVAELAGLKWSDIDFANKYMHISRTLNYNNGEWIEDTTKSRSGVRDIPLTDNAITILNSLKEKRKTLDVVPIQYHDFIFLSRNGTPISRGAYHKNLNKICKKINIPHISMHSLRHTFATRCAEAGMQPKTLQIILGHSSIDVTMNVYVHIMEDTKVKEIKSIESKLSVI